MQIFALTFLYCLWLFPNVPPSPVLEKIDPSLEAILEAGDRVDCIVLLGAQADLRDAYYIKDKKEKGRYVFAQLYRQHQRKQAPLRAFLEAEGISYTPLYLVNALRIKADRDILRKVASRPEVASIMNNPKMEVPRLRPEGPLLEARSQAPEWNLVDIRADQVWAMGYRGEGVVIGGQDTGFDWQHPTLIRQYRGSQGDTVDHNYNWYDAIHEYSPLHAEATNPCGLSTAVPCDDNVHGTHTMGTMVGEDTLGNQIGVAPKAQWVGVRNMERGYGNPFSYLEAFQWFLAPTDVNGDHPNPDMAPHVINNSWYCPDLEGCNESNIGLLEMAVENLRAAGIVVVTSAGNFGSDCATITELPAVFPASFAVGATDINQQIASFSSRGPVYRTDSSIMIKPDVSAPGVNVRSASLNGGFSAFSGTSMAGPHVVGTIALMISANPDLAGQVDSIEAILRRTARPRFSNQDCGPLAGDQSPNAVFGYGIINAQAAVEEALQFVISGTTSNSSAMDLRLFPNPTRDMIRLSRTDVQATLDLRLVNMQGQVLGQKRWAEGSTTLDWHLNLLPGLYLLHYTRGDKSYTKKLVVH